MVVLIAFGIYLLAGLFVSGLLTDWFANGEWQIISIFTVMWPLLAAILVKSYIDVLRAKFRSQ